jgi:hypothetical protein
MENLSYLDVRAFDDYYSETVNKIEQLTKLYKNAGVNLFVDKISNFHDEAQRIMFNVFNKTSVEYCINTLSINETNLQDKKQAAVSYLRNKNKKFICRRIISLINEQLFEPNVVVLGSSKDSFFQILSGGASESRLRGEKIRQTVLDYNSQLEDNDLPSNTFITSAALSNLENDVLDDFIYQDEGPVPHESDNINTSADLRENSSRKPSQGNHENDEFEPETRSVTLSKDKHLGKEFKALKILSSKSKHLPLISSEDAYCYSNKTISVTEQIVSQPNNYYSFLISNNYQ